LCQIKAFLGPAILLHASIHSSRYFYLINNDINHDVDVHYHKDPNKSVFTIHSTRMGGIRTSAAGIGRPLNGHGHLTINRSSSIYLLRSTPRTTIEIDTLPVPCNGLCA
jgi:hypothetical protein